MAAIVISSALFLGILIGWFAVAKWRLGGTFFLRKESRPALRTMGATREALLAAIWAERATQLLDAGGDDPDPRRPSAAGRLPRPSSAGAAVAIAQFDLAADPNPKRGGADSPSNAKQKDETE